MSQTRRRREYRFGMTDVELLADGGADSFAEFYRRHARRVAGYLVRSTGDVEAAADLTAETFAAALVARRRYRPDRGAPGTWLLGIATHKLNDWRRRGYAEDRARRRLRMERIELTAEDADQLERLGEEVSVIELIEELPAPQGEAVRARLVHERSYDDIAATQGISQAAARQRVSRGVAELRRRIEGGR
jgi:RNA polymerase sigma-70 factor (ECF subfamily)